MVHEEQIVLIIIGKGESQSSRHGFSLHRRRQNFKWGDVPFLWFGRFGIARWINLRLILGCSPYLHCDLEVQEFIAIKNACRRGKNPE
jgi:hypothetical protein